jgi:succinate-acetate transporter protein
MEKRIGNPAVVGLGGFGLTTLLLQLHNLDLVSKGPVLAMGIIFGGLAQMIAGFQEQKTGNNFGYAAFVGYGSFWIGLSIIWLLNHFKIYESSRTDVGWYLIAWTAYTLILFFASLRVHKAMTVTFGLLLLGFIFLDLGHFTLDGFDIVAAWILIACAFSAWYMMFATIVNDLAGKKVLKMGKSIIKNYGS